MVKGFLRFIARRPFLFAVLVICIACIAFGPASVGAWIGSHAREAATGAWSFGEGLFAGVF